MKSLLMASVIIVFCVHLQHSAKSVCDSQKQKCTIAKSIARSNSGGDAESKAFAYSTTDGVRTQLRVSTIKPETSTKRSTETTATRKTLLVETNVSSTGETTDVEVKVHQGIISSIKKIFFI